MRKSVIIRKRNNFWPINVLQEDRNTGANISLTVLLSLWITPKHFYGYLHVFRYMCGNLFISTSQLTEDEASTHQNEADESQRVLLELYKDIYP